MANWVTGIIIKNHKWTDSLFSLIIEAPIKQFIAGQYSKLALEINGQRIQRAYSYVNAPNDNQLEFYIVTVQEGKISPHLEALKPGDTIYVSEEAAGCFILEKLPDCKTLWMLATGTAIGPFLSILQFGENLNRFKNMILVHAVRYAEDLSYLLLMKKLEKKYRGKLKIQTIVSREKKTDSLTGRIPALIESGQLEQTVKAKIDPLTSHIMLCGNPQMVKDTQQLLKTQRGMNKHLHRKVGQITSEQYW
ncbi:Ferredoxin--NADP reductase [Arsenophonus endosymbiont of Aleurodicus dispersus]|uniref:ferredoxin--NADP(+) reductase n=1 Tax=Arsenophonus endosymbiont of Aleurodicus dispersus TaxID=235559 RepID=UPI000EB421A7|nr:ferredoxin--NADP(+) reductase [Arsenophonus endosymbiont of Aleurodicus dispersus]VAY02497.1 Ferredoxin--NADP reductase [Arsenophonus endosymbiont of Aleurodicus dispersus]